MKKLFTLTTLALMLCAGAAYGQLLTTIYDINQGNVPENTEVRVENIVVTAVAGFGFYCQDQLSGEYSGIWAYTGSANPPTVIIGDLVTVEGEYYEYYQYAEIDLTGGSYEVVGSGAVPDPILVRAWQVKTANPVEAEKWESVLVTLENLNPLDLDPGYGAYFAEEFDFAVNDTLRLDDQFDHGQPGPGELLSSATGVVRYTFDEFCVNPRGNYDLVYAGAAPAPNLDWAIATGDMTIDVKFDRSVEQTSAENAFNYFLDIGTVVTAERDDVDLDIVHLTLDAAMTPEVQLSLTVFDVQNSDGVPMTPQDIQFWGGINTVVFASTPNAGGDSSAVAGDYITIDCVVHSKYDVYGSHVYVQGLTPGGDYDGLEVYLTSLLDEVEVGDVLRIGDYLTEYYSETSMTEPFMYFEILSSGHELSDPYVMDIDGGDYEVYEGALVKVENVVVVERPGNWNFYEWSVTQDELNWLKIGDLAPYDFTPGLGDTLTITGTLRYNFNEFKIEPRGDEDIEIIYQNPVGVEDGPAAFAQLGQNYPNPFNPTTEIAFSLAQAGAARLEVFDVQGRLLKTLANGAMAAGAHSVVWHGDTDAGEQASSGVYFYRLSAEGRTMTRRMLLLK